MVLSGDQQRVKTLLQDTIALLCKNGLTFDREFTIDAVIGVTLDNQSLFYMSFNDIIKSDKRVSPEPEPRPDDAVDMSASRRKRPRRERSPSVTSDDESDGPNSSQKLLNPKIELIDSDDNEPVFVKQEMNTDWQLSATELTDNNFVAPGMSRESSTFQTHPEDFSSQNTSGSSLWIGGNTPPSIPGGALPGTSPRLRPDSDQAMMFGQSLFQLGLPGFQMNLEVPLEKTSPSKPYSYKCSLCTKSFSCPDNLKGHMTVHTGVKQFYCPRCGKGYQYNSTLQRHIKVGCSQGDTGLNLSVESPTMDKPLHLDTPDKPLHKPFFFTPTMDKPLHFDTPFHLYDRMIVGGNPNESNQTESEENGDPHCEPESSQ